MRNPAFYEIAAQVLPTVLLVVVIEIRTLWSLTAQGLVVSWVVDTLQNWVAAAVIFGAIFFLGEAAALTTVYVGVDGWFPWIAAPVTMFALAMVMLAALFMLVYGLQAIGRLEIQKARQRGQQ